MAPPTDLPVGDGRGWSELPDLAELPDGFGVAALACGRATYRERLYAERRNLRWTSGVIQDLCDAAAPVELISIITRMARVEASHVDLCAAAIEALGGHVAEDRLPALQDRGQGWPANARVLRSMIEMLCIEATLSVAQLSAMRRSTRSPISRALLSHLLADESRHSQIGWRWLEAESRHMAPGMRDWVMDWLPALLADVEARCRPSLDEVTQVQHQEICPFGGLTAAEREVAFLRAMHERILPGLARARFDGTSAWSMRPDCAA